MNKFDLLRNQVMAGVVSLTAAGVMLTGCGESTNTGAGTSAGSSANVSGPVDIDGSSTVRPISAAMGQVFQNANPDAKVVPAQSGTGGGFKKFANKEIDIAGASRPIDEEEIAA